MCLPEPVTAKWGILGRILDPGLATSELVGKVYKPAGQILNPGKWDDLMTPEPPKQQEAPKVDRGPDPEKIARDNRDNAIRQANEERRKKSILQQANEQSEGISKNAQAEPIGAQKLDSILTRGKKTILGT